MMRIADGIELDERELDERFVRASGPGGQNVNKVSTAVELRWHVRGSRSLPVPVRDRLEQLVSARITADGVLIIRAERFRTQERNRVDARARLTALIRRAAVEPKSRIRTVTPRSSRRERLEGKIKRSSLKRLRRSPPESD